MIQIQPYTPHCRGIGIVCKEFILEELQFPNLIHIPKRSIFLGSDSRDGKRVRTPGSQFLRIGDGPHPRFALKYFVRQHVALAFLFLARLSLSAGRRAGAKLVTGIKGHARARPRTKLPTTNSATLQKFCNQFANLATKVGELQITAATLDLSKGTSASEGSGNSGT